MKNIIKQYPKTFISSVCLLIIVIAAACTLKIKTDDPVITIRVIVPLPDGGVLNVERIVDSQGNIIDAEVLDPTNINKQD